MKALTNVGGDRTRGRAMHPFACRQAYNGVAMTLMPTIIILVACIATFAVASLLSRRSRRLDSVDLVPYLPIQFLAILGIVLMLAHLVSLLTGHPFTGRGR